MIKENMKQLLRHTSMLLRTVMLLGVLAIISIPTKAQPVSLTADMPDAFETINANDPSKIIGNGEYYFIQYYYEIQYSPYLFQSFLGEAGEGQILHAMDYLPYAPNRQWTLVQGSSANQFKLKSKRGFYAYLDGNRFKSTANEANASEFTLTNRGSYRAGYKYYELRTTGNITMGRYAGTSSNSEWADMINVGNSAQFSFFRFAKLKSNAAHIIYYREEGEDNSNPQALTTRHYLTHSGTGNPPASGTANLRSSAVSSRRSIIPSDKSLWTLPTAAVYHQDGLWTLEEASGDGEFYIKKYGQNDEYLNPSGTLSVLGAKDLQYGKYSLETPTANRYTRIQNNTKSDFTALSSSHFYQWNSSTAGAASTASANVTFNVGNNTEIGNLGTVVGTSEVWYHTYADMTGCQKLVIEGTPGMYLVLRLNRQEPIAEGADGYDSHGGSFVQRFCTIDEYGRAEVDVSDLPYVHINSIKNWGATAGVVNSINIIRPKIESVPLDRNQFHYWNDLNGVSINTEYPTDVQVHLNENISSSNNLVAGTGSVYYLTYADLSGSKKMVFTGTSGMELRVILNRQEPIAPGETGYDGNGGSFVERVTTIGSNGYAEVDLSDLPYVHLNSIKVRSGEGTISSINLIRLATDSDTRYLNHADGDGWQVLQWTGDNGNYWYAGFYPVEVPVSQKDEFFQVRLILNPPYGTQEDRIPIYLNPGKHSGVTLNSTLRSDGDNIIGAKYTPSDAWQNCFQYNGDNALTIPNGYQKIIVRFASPVPAGWAINGIVPDGNGWKQGWEAIPEGSMYYEMNLTGQINGNNITSITDFTIFSTATSSAIEIAEIYFYKGDMLNNTNGSSMHSSEANPSLWQLEQVDDYTQFRLKNPNTGKYLAGNGQMTEPNDPSGEVGTNKAEVNPNSKFWTDFTPKWYIPTKSADKEIRVNHYVRHKESYLRTYADDQVITNQKGLKKQGLSTDIDSDWKNFNGNLDGFTQNVNHFEITHYLKKGSSRVIEFPTVLNKNNDHIFFQRFYHYDELDTGANGTGMDLDNLKAHVSLDTRDDGDVQYFLYNNGMVTGQKLDWRTYANETYTNIPDGGMARNEQRRFNFTNSDGQRFTVAVDVSRYSDLEYLNNPDHLAGDLREPSLTMRYLFYMRDAKEMATSLTNCTETTGKWLEEKEFHYGRTQVPYTKFKKVGYRGEFIGLRHIFSDYWVFDGNGTGDENLVSAVNSNSEGKIVVEIYDPNNTGIRLGGYNPNIDLNSQEANEGNDADYQGFYFYDKLSPSPKTEYGNSRFVVFRYPSTGIVDNYGPDKPAYIRVYLKNGETKYQLAQFTLFFDANMATRPWTRLNNGTSYANGVNQVKGTSRDPNQLRAMAGKPIAKVTFDYPKKMKISESEVNATYHFPSTSDCPSTDGVTRHNGGDRAAGGTIANSSPVPLTFGHTNYAFDGDDCNWGSYAIVTQKSTAWGNQKMALPADDDTYGYGLPADEGMQKAFMYIDASEQPGDICAVEFEGEFCANDQLMCSGWISGSNKIQNDTRCPGSITLTVKGEDASGNTNTIYRFCPGQIYELDNGYGDVGQGDADIVAENGAGIDGNGNGATHVVWQQFYFEFSTDKNYERYWLEVNNNCVSSNGGDFMLDNIEVYTIVPEVLPDINTPLCVQRDGTSEMRLLKLEVDHNKLVSSAAKQGVTTQTPYLGLVFLEKETFLTTLRQELGETGVSLDVMAERVESGYYDNTISGSNEHYQNAFNAALLRSNNSTAIWKSDNRENNKGAGVMYFQWDKTFESNTIQPVYSFANAVAKTSAVYRTTEGGVDYIVLNGNYPELPWKTSTDYYIVPTNTIITNFSDVYDAFNICSNCSKASTFQIEPPYKILSMESTDITDDYAFCEGKIPTLLVDLKGYTAAGEETLLKDLNYDWWLGSDTKLATLENYHSETNTAGTVKLDESLYAFRYHYPGVTSVEGVTEQLTKQPYLSKEMIYYLQELVNKGELVLHQKSISIPSLKTSADDPYFYLVACPIRDGDFHNAIGSSAYFCEEPQGLRMKVGDKAPGLKCGFVPNENGFSTYNYPSGNLTLSVRLAKRAQFETVKHGDAADPTETWEGSSNKFLWLPLRDAEVRTEESTKVIQKSGDDNIYLASTDDPVWDKAIYTAMSKVDKENKPIGALPIVGKIVQLNAIDKSKDANASLTEKDQNRLCVYFTENFEVREGYNYTLSLPFREAPGTNTCDGTILLHLKIVPDYEVWTGAAGNTDWNNDQNWRRADGNQATPTTESTDGSALNNNELLVSGDLPTESGLKDYTTNYANYRTAKDRLLRKGYAPLYCTHILLKSNEWGDTPVLFDALNGKDALDAAPFPNLSETYEVNTVAYSIDESDRYTSIGAIGENSFAIVNETDSKAFYGSNAQNLGYGSYEAAMQYTNSGFYFKLKSAQNVSVVTDGNPYYLLLQTPSGQDYTVWGSPGYLNSQPTSGNLSFILGLNDQNGQDIENGAVWTLEESGGKFALKNVGTGLYLKDASSAKYDTPTYFTFCKLQGETISSSSDVRANVLKYDIQAREYSIWKDTYGSDPDKGRAGDLIAEMYQINSCDEIALQPSAELMNAHLLNYNNAWMEYQIDMNRWYLLGSALQGTISGEWYAPTGNAQQKTTYYENVTFGEGYDRYSPAIYQRSWDKAKAVLYEVGSEYNKNDDSQTENLGTPLQGKWNNGTWNTTGADNYLDRLGYKPMGGKKANVAIKGVWSNTYNDATVDYATGAFSVMVLNNLKPTGTGNAKPAIIRLPKEDAMYDYYRFEETGADNGGTDTELTGDNGVQTQKNRAKNRGRLKTDLLLPLSDTSLPTYQKIQRTETAASRYGDKRTYTRVPSQVGANGLPMTLQNIQETVSAGASNLGYYLVENPFPCGMSMEQFFADNSGLEKKYWLLTAKGQQLIQYADNQWVNPDGTAFAAANAIIAPGQGFFVQATTPGQATAITFNKDMQAKSRYGVKNGTTKIKIVVGSREENGQVEEIENTVEINNYEQDDTQQYPLKAPRTRAAEPETALTSGMVITAQRDDMKSNALVMQREGATDDFLPAEDTETFLNSDLKQVPTVYTLCGRLATTINTIRDFSCLPLGVESASDAPCLLTFQNVEALGDSIAFYDAVRQELTPLKSGMQFTVSGQTQNRYYLVSTLIQEQAATETHLQIFAKGGTVTVIASTDEPLTSVRCYDTGGRLIHSASPQTATYSFQVPVAGIYVIDAQTENDRKTMKVTIK